MMRGMKFSLALATVAVISLALVAQDTLDRSAGVMATAADRFVKSLDDDQRQKATFEFGDDERLNWHFIPRERKGLPLKDMNDGQRALAFGLIQSGLSQSGNLKATTIMSLEAILREMENDSGARRNPELYFVSVFGEPSNTGDWGWRVEGHHLSLNFTIKDGAIASATPAFFGANPAEVRQGPREGLRALAEFEDRALRLVQALDDDQRSRALVAETAPGDVSSNTGAGQTSPYGGLAIRPPSTDMDGISARDLNDDQRRMLMNLIRAYAYDMPAEVAKSWLGEVDDAGDNMAFAWFGATERNQPHGYQIQGPTFQIEFNNTQNNANHIHSLWRTTMDDFAVAAAE